MRSRILLLTGLLALVSALWLFQGLGPNRDFVLGLRLGKLAALLLVAASVGVATILFQTVAQNRILTPAIMGFDALYLLIQSLLVASLGTAAFASLPAVSKFAAETLVMAAVAVALFGALLGQARGDSIGRTILTGVILGILFRSGATLVGRMLDPNEYSVVQQVSFANFSRPATDTTGWAAAAALPAIAAALWFAPRFDVLALGRESAISLGLPHRPMVLGTLALVAVLTAVSTALVGPVALFGLIIAGFAHAIAPGARHLPLLIAAALIASVLLVGGQWAFERVLGQKATLSVVIDFAGGVFFLALLLKGKVR